MNETKTSAPDGGLSAEQQGLRLPPDLELLELVGQSRWARTYKAHYEGETIALRAYTDNAASWYRKKLDKNVAVFEMLQNRKFRAKPELLPYTAKPIRVIGQDGKQSLCFLQEFVDGLTLEELGRQQGGIPGYLLEIGQAIASYCEENQIAGIDQFMGHALFRKENKGWTPIMYDFKHIPEEPKKPAGPSFLSRLGFGSRNSPATTGFMRDWRALEAKLQRS